jgi:hypothetical protein
MHVKLYVLKTNIILLKIYNKFKSNSINSGKINKTKLSYLSYIINIY